MSMRTTLTVTSKGQTTLPVVMRRKLGVPASGGVLHVDLDEQSGAITITRPISLEELSARVSKNIKPGTTPLTDVNSYYQANRRLGT